MSFGGEKNQRFYCKKAWFYHCQNRRWLAFSLIDTIMDNELFLKRLSELAEWERRQVGPNGASSVNKRLKAEDPDLELSPDSFNESLAPTIVKIKTCQRNCEDCGCVVTDRKVYRKLNTTNRPHWRDYCTACKLYKDPRTGEFSLNSKQSQVIHQAVTRGEGKYKSKYQPNITRDKTLADK